MAGAERGRDGEAGRHAWPLLALTALIAWPGLADAHAVRDEAGGFVSGLMHPISGLDHVAAMVAVGLWGAQLGPPALWLLPIAFPLVMAVGGFLGFTGLHLPGAEVMIAASGIVLGAAVLAAWRAPIWAAAILVGIFGLFHGYAHGVELKPGLDAFSYSAGFVLATGLLHLTGILIGLAHRWRWGASAIRAAGGAVLVCGLVFLRAAMA